MLSLALGVMCSDMCTVYLSIWRGVGDFSVSATSQFNPFTHMVISSSDVAEETEIHDRLLTNILSCFLWIRGLKDMWCCTGLYLLIIFNLFLYICTLWTLYCNCCTPIALRINKIHQSYRLIWWFFSRFILWNLMDLVNFIVIKCQSWCPKLACFVWLTLSNLKIPNSTSYMTKKNIK